MRDNFVASKQADCWSIPCPVNKVLRVSIMLMRSRFANYHGVAHVQAKMIPMNLIWSEWAQWLLSSGICNISGALITPMGMPIMPPWANYHHNAHPQAKTVQINLIWNEPAQWLLNSCVCKIPEARVTPNGTPLMPPWANDQNTEHLYAKTVPMGMMLGVNQPSGCWVMASARFQEPLSHPWACSLCPHGQMTKMLHIYKPKQF